MTSGCKCASAGIVLETQVTELKEAIKAEYVERAGVPRRSLALGYDFVFDRMDQIQKTMETLMDCAGSPTDEPWEPWKDSYGIMAQLFGEPNYEEGIGWRPKVPPTPETATATILELDRIMMEIRNILDGCA